MGDGDDVMSLGGTSGSWQHMYGQFGDDTYVVRKEKGNTAFGEHANQGFDVAVF